MAKAKEPRLRLEPNRHSPNLEPKRTVDGRSLLDGLVKAATGGKAFHQACRPLSQDDRQSLSRALRMDVDQFRAEFASRLRETGLALLADLQARKDELKPGEIAYALAVVADKHQALEARNQVSAASVNIQINSFGSDDKSEVLKTLFGSTKESLPVTPTNNQIVRNLTSSPATETHAGPEISVETGA